MQAQQAFYQVFNPKTKETVAVFKTLSEAREEVKWESSWGCEIWKHTAHQAIKIEN